MAYKQRTGMTVATQSVLTDDPDFLRPILERVVQAVLETEMTAHLHADPYERSADRRGYRNGYKPRQLSGCRRPRALRGSGMAAKAAASGGTMGIMGSLRWGWLASTTAILPGYPLLSTMNNPWRATAPPRARCSFAAIILTVIASRRSLVTCRRMEVLKPPITGGTTNERHADCNGLRRA